MATEFKVVYKSSAATDAVPNTSNTNNDIYKPGVNTDTVVIGLLLANKLGASIIADVAVVQNLDGSGSGVDVYIVKGVQIPGGSSLEIMEGKVVLTHDGSNGDLLRAIASTGSALDIVVSVLEDVA